MKKQVVEATVEEPVVTEIVVGDTVFFHQYNESEEHAGEVMSIADTGKLIVEFPDIGTFPINRCYLRK